MEVQAFNPSTGRERQVDLCEFKASLVYKVRYRTARTATQRNPVSKKQNKTTIKKVTSYFTIYVST